MNTEIINGNNIALELKQEITQEVKKHPGLNLAVVVVGGSQATEKYIEKKKQFGEDVGVNVEIKKYDSSISEEGLLEKIGYLNEDENINGIIIQLPLPEHINTERILQSVPKEKDVDALTEGALVLSPVVGAIVHILEKYQIDLENKKVAVVGYGKLVGRPITKWLKEKNIEPVVADKKTEDISSLTKEADLIISGAGSPGIIHAGIIKEGVVIIDAGTSEDSGRLAGDASFDCIGKASLFTPVPGGIGPITITIIFKNLLKLSR